MYKYKSEYKHGKVDMIFSFPSNLERLVRGEDTQASDISGYSMVSATILHERKRLLRKALIENCI